MRPGPEVAVYLCAAPVDMRRQANGLALLVEQSLQRSVFEPALFCFSNRRRDRVKIVYWERNGLCLWSKRLEGRELNALLDGFDVVRRGHRDLEFRRVG